MQQEEAGQAEPVDHPQLLLQAGVRARHGRPRRAGSARPAAPSRARRACAAPAGPPRRDSGSRGPTPRSNRRRSASAPLSATASGWPSKRAAIAAGVASTWAVLPRRTGSEASSVRWWRRATNASCSGARVRACAWTLPVATVGTPSRGRARPAQRLRARSWRWNGRCSSTRRWSVPEGREQPAQRRLVVYAAVGAAAQADEPLRVLLERLQRDGRRRLASDRAVVRVGARDDPAQVAPAGGVGHEQRDVAVASVRRAFSPPSRRPSPPRGSPAARAAGRPARTPSTPRRRCGR